jgi:deoxycytidine triphosphate deaminase
VEAPNSQLKPGILPYQEILELCGLKENTLPETLTEGPIQPCRRQNVRSASYDLRLGPEYYVTDGSEKANGIGSMKVQRLIAGSDEHIVLRPNQVVIVSSLEKVCLGPDMIGHLTLKQDILLEGLMMASQSQVDAGYQGWIYPLLYNLTDGDVMLRLSRSVIRLELVRLAQPSQRPYDGDYQQRTLSQALKRPIGSSLAELREDVDEGGRRIANTRWWTAGLAVFAVLLPIFIGYVTGFFGEVNETRDRVSRVEGERAGSLQLDDKLTRLEDQVSTLQCQVREEQGLTKANSC